MAAVLEKNHNCAYPIGKLFSLFQGKMHLILTCFFSENKTIIFYKILLDLIFFRDSGWKQDKKFKVRKNFLQCGELIFSQVVLICAVAYLCRTKSQLCRLGEAEKVFCQNTKKLL